MIYLIMFILSIIFLSLGLNYKKRIYGKFLIFIGLLFPCIMAGLRGITVGTDTKGYVLNLYNIAFKMDSFNSLIKMSELIYFSSDKLYLLITYISSKWLNSFQIMLFIYQCLIIFPIYFSLKNIAKKNQDIVFGMLIFYFTLYNLSLNMVRQSIAISFVMLGFSYLKKELTLKNKFLSFLYLIIAIGFHDTALFGIIIYLIYLKLNNPKNNEKSKNLFCIIITCITVFSLIFYKPLLIFIANIGIYPKALVYINKFSNFNIDFLGTIINVLLIIMVVLTKDQSKKMNLNYKFGLLLTILNLLISFIGIFITYTQRLSYYFYFIIISNYIAPLCSNNLKKGNIYLKTVIVFFAFFVYWLIVICINNNNETLPYVFFR